MQLGSELKDGAAKPSGWRNCPTCGHQNGAWESRCEKCGRRAQAPRPQPAALPAASGEPPRAAPSPKIVPRPPAFPEHLRRHIHDRVQRFRTRQEGGSIPLPFEEEIEEPLPKVIRFPALAAPVPATMEAPSAPRQARRPDPVSEQQPGFDFHSGVLEEQVWRMRPVASVRVRLAAQWHDLKLLLAGSLLFCSALLIIIPRFGPRFGVPLQGSLILLSGLVCGLLLLPLLYGLLFVWGAGVTPGMKAAGLRLVGFDGLPASRRRRLWRVLGAVVSAGSFLIGFLWAMVDEEKLCWHDHISKTYLTLSDS